jgi:hypothetical protein
MMNETTVNDRIKTSSETRESVWVAEMAKEEKM